MPLDAGSSHAVISGNIRELVAAGHGQRQAVAIALSNAQRHPHRSFGGLAASAPWTRNEARGMDAAPHFGGSSRGFGLGHGIGLETAPRPFPAPHVGMGPPKPMAAPHFDMGGVMSASQADPWWTRSESRGMDYHPGGLINSEVAGRTDRLPLAVAADSHVIPADVVSGLGQGNTLAGSRILDSALRVGPFGVPLDNLRHGSGPPRPQEPPRMNGAQPESMNRELEPENDPAIEYARGGAKFGHAEILAAGGEYIVSPEAVLRLGAADFSPAERQKFMEGGDLLKARKAALKRGHEALDQMIAKVRAHTIKFIKNARPPVK